MRIDYNLYRKANELLRFGNFSRQKLQDTLKISDRLAGNLMFAVENNSLIGTYKEDNFEKDKEVLVLPDAHIPYHSKTATGLVEEHAKGKKYDKIIFLGDTMDTYSVSSFTKDPGRKSLEEEVKGVVEWLTYWRERYPTADIYYYIGNHEERLRRSIWKNLPQLDCVLIGLFEKLLKLDELNIKLIENPFKIGKLWFLHGHERGGMGGNAMHITYIWMKHIYDNFVVGHSHKRVTTPFKRLDGSYFLGASLGWLGDTKYIEYAKVNQYTQGFAEVTFNKHGEFKINNYLISGERILL